MRFLALASDYDGTLAEEGVVSPETLAAITRLKHSGRKFILVTGRELPELKQVFPLFAVCDLIVAENGAVLYRPQSDEARLLAPGASAEFVERLKSVGVGPISTGHCIVATWEPHEETCLKVIRDMQLELTITFNKGAVMILPAGVTKATGLAAALEEIGIAREAVVGVGDAENDHAFLRVCGFSAAVRNALQSVKDLANWTTPGARGAGVTQLIDEMIARDDKLFDLIPAERAKGAEAPLASIRKAS